MTDILLFSLLFQPQCSSYKKSQSLLPQYLYLQLKYMKYMKYIHTAEKT